MPVIVGKGKNVSLPTSILGEVGLAISSLPLIISLGTPTWIEKPVSECLVEDETLPVTGVESSSKNIPLNPDINEPLNVKLSPKTPYEPEVEASSAILYWVVPVEILPNLSTSLIVGSVPNLGEGKTFSGKNKPI